jgi:hypothetical protein
MLRVFMAHAIAKGPAGNKWWTTPAIRRKVRVAVEASQKDKADITRTSKLVADLKLHFKFILAFERDPPEEDDEDAGDEEGDGDNDGEQAPT